MLAKIAHSYAIAKHGRADSFEPVLKKLIRGKSNTPTYYVGGDPIVLPPQDGVPA